MCQLTLSITTKLLQPESHSLTHSLPRPPPLSRMITIKSRRKNIGESTANRAKIHDGKNTGFLSSRHMKGRNKKLSARNVPTSAPYNLLLLSFLPILTPNCYPIFHVTLIHFQRGCVFSLFAKKKKNYNYNLYIVCVRVCELQSHNSHTVWRNKKWGEKYFWRKQENAITLCCRFPAFVHDFLWNVYGYR